jgi:hypothetical protein
MRTAICAVKTELHCAKISEPLRRGNVVFIDTCTAATL